jgi:hypothetical protein
VRILLDECVNRKFGQLLVGHEVLHVSEAGLESIQNGALLRAAASSFDALVTIDKNMPFQTNLQNMPLVAVVLDVRDSSLEELTPFAAKLLESIDQLEPGEFHWLR